ncbi:MAG: aminomethyl-transferring glycine dehydrogenase subunit GcvPB, partial [Chloroflexota bacterium]
MRSGRREPEPLIFEKSAPGRRAGTLPPCDVPQKPLTELLPEGELRQELNLPEVSELDVVRHFTRLSKLNYSVDGEFYPLGSCTMKYNPKLDENVAALPGFRQLHPLQPEETAQGALRVLYELERLLAEITG